MAFLFNQQSQQEDIWKKDYERIQRRIEQLQINASTRGGGQNRGVNYVEMRAILKEEVLLDAQLQRDIVANAYTSKELLRRTDLLKKLNSDIKRLDGIIVGDAPPAPPDPNLINSVYASGSMDPERGDDPNFSMQAELQRQEYLEQEQEQGLDALCNTLVSLNAIGKDINQEIVFQEGLLSDLEQSTDQTQTRMEYARTKVQEIGRSTSSKCLVCLNIVLFLLVVIALLSILFK